MSNLLHEKLRRNGAIAGLIAGLAILVSFGGDALGLALRYDREGVGAGELWRLLSGHLVHLDGIHLLLNIAGLFLLAKLLERFLPPVDLLSCMLVSALVIDAGLYFANPELAWYVGLSGILHGVWAAGCLMALWQRNFAVLPLAAILAIKLIVEMAGVESMLSAAVISGPVVTEAHAWGALGGGIWSIAVIAIRHLRASL